MARGTGQTTRQMLGAPKGAVYIWFNHHLDYPKNLARDLGRGDLKIVSPSWLSAEKIYGIEISGVIVDHTVAMAGLSDKQWNALDMARSRQRI